MRDLKQQMKEKDIKVAYKGRRKELYDALQYDLFIGRKHFPMEYAPDRLKWMAFEEIEKKLGDDQTFSYSEPSSEFYP